MSLSKIRISAWGPVLLALTLAPKAHAMTFYLDTGAGISKLSSNAPLFGSGAASSTDMGFALNVGVFGKASGSNSPAEFHFGLQTRLSSAGSGSSNYLLLTPFPVVRLQMSYIFLSAGLSPLGWKRTGAALGFDSMTLFTPGLAYFGEAGFLWPLAPIFSLGLSGAATYVSSQGALSPAPAFDGVFFMRFYLGTLGSSGSDPMPSSEFKGWRYPFGQLR